MKKKRITIGQKLIGGFSIVLSLIIILSIVFFYTISRMNRASNSLIENLEFDMFLDEKIGDHLRWVNELSDQFLLGRPFEGELDPHKCDFGKWYDVFETNGPETVEVYQAIAEPHNRLHYSAGKIKKLYEAGKFEEAKRVYAEETEPAFNLLQEKIENFAGLSMTKLFAVKQEYISIVNISRIIVLSVVFFSICIAFVIAILISRGISTSVHKLTEASTIIAQGDLTTKIKINTNDEIGDLAISFNKMVNDLRLYMQKEKELAAAEAAAAAAAEVEKKKAVELSQIYNGSPSGIRVVNRDFIIMSQNEAMIKLSGVEKRTTKNMKCYEQFKGALCETEYCPLRQILNGKEIIDTEVVKERLDGRKFPCRVMASPFKNIEGEILGIIEVFTDITKIKETEEKLVRSEKLAVLGQLSGTVGHELRNPLCAIKNSTYYLKNKLEYIQDKKIKKHINILDQQVDLSNKIITDILSFARVKEPQLNKVNINEVIEESLEMVLIPVNIEVGINLMSDFYPIMADEIQLQQVFSNIISNAVQAMPDGGTLSITGSRNEEFIEVVVSDTGEGIPKENMDKIFEPLFSTKAHGTGLGLPFCLIVVELHKGKIEIESNAGEGTSFIVKLPINYV